MGGRFHLAGFLQRLITLNHPRRGALGPAVDTRQTRHRRQSLLRDLRASGISDPAVLAALERVPRHAFFPARYQYLAYDNDAYPIGWNQTISQPSLVALMTSLLRLTPTSRVLEIGTGSGYQTAILAEFASAVYSLERVEPLLQRTEPRLAELGYTNIQFRLGDGALGWPEAAPFDAIIVTCAAPVMPAVLEAQLTLGGCLVVPVGPPGGKQMLWLVTRMGEDTYSQEQIEDVKFVPLVPGPAT